MAQAVHEARCLFAPLRGRTGTEAVRSLAGLPLALESRLQSALLALPMQEARAFDFDRLVLGVAAGQLAGRLGAGPLRPVCVTADFALFLDRRAADRYLGACRDLDERLRRHLILLLTGLPHGVLKSRVLDCATRLRPFCQGVGFEADNLQVPPVEFSMMTGAVVMLHANDLKAWDLDALVRLEKLIGVVRAHRGRVLARGLETSEQARRLMKLGVDLVGMAEPAGGLSQA